MAVCNTLTNPVNLKKLKTNNIFEQFELVLKEDIWQRGILILRSGRFLNEDIINKLINFGVNEINIHLKSDYCDKDEYKAVEELKRNFINTQDILVIDKNFKDIGSLAKNLEKIGFNQKNIFASTNIKALNKYIQDKVPDYLFINYSKGIEGYIRAINEIEIFQNTHIILMISYESETDINKLKNKANILEVPLIFKPVLFNDLKNLVSQFINYDFNRLLDNENNKNTYKQKTIA